MPRVASVNAGNRWTARLMPVILLALAAVACYVVTGRVCIDTLLPRHEVGAVIAILTLLYILLLLSIACYLRTLFTIVFDPGAVPLPVRAGEQGGSDHRIITSEEAARINNNAMSQFWTKDVFACTDQGSPGWCSECKNWKPDRSHHSKELARCIRKMDHYCPWMGGIISGTSFKFFIQFTMYASLFCALCMSSAAYVLRLRVIGGLPLDPWIVIVVALGAFFAIFTFTMSTNSMRFAYLNLTTIDIIGHKELVRHLAIRVSRSVPPSPDYRLVTFPPPEAANPAAGIHTFAVVQTKPGESPWDLGYYKNWKSIMGESVIDWFLPLRPSPETTYSSNISDYPVGPAYEALRERYNLGSIEGNDEKRGRKRRRKHRTKH